MATSTDNNTTPVMEKTLLFYQKPVPLNRDKHKDLRLRKSPAGMFSFASETNSVPLAGQEFVEACRYYPIVFAGTDAATAVPSALLGLHDQENLFVDADGAWAPTYVPAFVRRYPFVLGEKPDANDFAVLVDEGYPGFNHEEGEQLFDEEGAESDFLKQAKQFLSQFQAQVRRTQGFVTRLNEYDLLIDRVIQGTTAGGEKYVLRGFYVVDEQRLQSLTDAQLRKLFANGELAWLYAHLISMRNLRELSQRLEKQTVNEHEPEDTTNNTIN